jgi:hypothetical protein
MGWTPVSDNLATHAADCAMVTTHHLTCTCGAVTTLPSSGQEPIAATPLGEPMDVVQVVVPVGLIPFLTACLKIRHIELYGPVPLPGSEDDLPTYFVRPDAVAMEASRSSLPT